MGHSKIFQMKEKIFKCQKIGKLEQEHLKLYTAPLFQNFQN